MDAKRGMIVVDGNSIVNRAFYGVRMLTNSKGFFTNAIYGFLNILYKYIDKENPEYLCIAFDVKHPTFRHEKYPEYKAGRHGMPEELRMQIPVLKEVLDAMNIKIIELPGYEADDILGTISNMCNVEGIYCSIVTGDRDALQLATGTSKIFLTSTKSGNTVTDVLDEKEIINRFGFSPESVVDAKGLMGDSSDNIPGVAGIGEKTAYSLIKDYGTLENVYEHIDEIKGKLKEKLEKGKDSAFFSRDLATICKTVPIGITLDECRVKDPDNEKVAKLLTELECTNLLSRLDIKKLKKEYNFNIKIINHHNECLDAVKRINLAEKTAIYFFKVEAEPVGVCATAEDTLYYFDFTGGLLSELDVSDLKELFESNTPKVMHYSKDEKVYLNNYGIKLNGISFDTAIAGYILEPSRSKYDIYSMVGITPDEEFIKSTKKKTILDLSAEKIADMGKDLCGGMLNLYETQLEDLKNKKQEQLLYDIELPLSDALADMEIQGFKVNKKRLAEFSENLDKEISALVLKIYEKAGCEFNVNSTKQLGEVLFEKMGMPVIKKTKTGYSTDSDVLDRLETENDIITDIKQYRVYSKLKSTYCDGLLQVIDPKDDKIHSKFMQTVTVTGRISSTEPNLQNIPIRLDIGREIRKMFVADEGMTLVDADYSQIELRVLAHIADDEDMIKAFKNNDDIHTITASQVFGVPIDEVTSKMRSNAKAVNFGIVYGISDFALGVDLGISKKEAKAYIDGYLEKYSGVKKYMTQIVEDATQAGYVTTLFGRRRYIPELKSSKFMERSFGQRVAMNTPIQGSAADIIKIAMVKVSKRLKEENLKSKLILQVHDELIIEAPNDEVKRVKSILKEEMENAVTLNVPLIAETTIGNSWYDCK
ncbi:MAG: DNA polymerase I [Clostridia bacterium]|nr:DNA polymerase I [Clostridia bacterium]